MLDGKTYLNGQAGYGCGPRPGARGGLRSASRSAWRGCPRGPGGSRAQGRLEQGPGPGTVTFADAKSPVTTATFSAGRYVLELRRPVSR